MSLYKEYKEHKLTVIRSTEIGSLCNIINFGSYVFLISSFCIPLLVLDNFLLALSHFAFSILIFFIARVVRLYLILKKESNRMTHHNAVCYQEQYTFYFSGIIASIFGHPFMYNAKAEQNLGDHFFALIFLISLTVFAILGIYKIFKKLEIDLSN